jgi:hypothetical protein
MPKPTTPDVLQWLQELADTVAANAAGLAAVVQRLDNLNIPPPTGGITFVPGRLRIIGAPKTVANPADFDVTWDGDTGLRVSMALDDGTREYVARGGPFQVQTSKPGKHAINAWIGNETDPTTTYFVVV